MDNGKFNCFLLYNTEDISKYKHNLQLDRVPNIGESIIVQENDIITTYVINDVITSVQITKHPGYWNTSVKYIIKVIEIK